MKKNILLLFVLLSSLRLWAQTFGVTHNFTNSPDGGIPRGGLTANNATLYGTTVWGGVSGSGTIYKIDTNGFNYALLKSFGPLVDRYNLYTNMDGANPAANVVIAGGTIFGTTAAGGSFGNGIVFRMNTNGTQFTVLKDFTNDVKGAAVDGATPTAGLLLISNTLYGTVAGALGGIFKMDTNGGHFTIIRNISPIGELSFSGDTLYGIDGGSIFSIKTNGMNYSTIENFSDPAGGSGPDESVALIGNTLYGSTTQGGTEGWGTLFKVNTDGSGFTVLRNHSFFIDGTAPRSKLILAGDSLYGTAYNGGPSAYGTLYGITTNGTGLASVQNFTSSGGTFPCGNLTLIGNTLYGTTSQAGIFANGTAYSLDLTTINETIMQSNSALKISWNSISNHVYQLQFTTNLTSPNWQNFGSSITATNGIVSQTIQRGAAMQSLYRINLLQ